MSFSIVLIIIAPVYCFYSCAARVCWNPRGFPFLAHQRTKQNTHEIWDLWISAAVGDSRGAAPSAGNTLLHGCTGKPCLRFVGYPSTHSKRSRCLATKTSFPRTPPPSSRHAPGPFSHSEAPTASPRTVIGAEDGRCLRKALCAGAGRQRVDAGFSRVPSANPALVRGAAPSAGLSWESRPVVEHSRAGAIIRVLCSDWSPSPPFRSLLRD